MKINSWRKNIFFDLGIPPKREKLENFYMVKIEEKINTYRYIPLVGVCHVWFACSRGTNTEIPKIKNTGVPPLNRSAQHITVVSGMICSYKFFLDKMIISSKIINFDFLSLKYAQVL